MEKTRLYGQYCDILREELIPAMGCTEPIAVAYAACRARHILGIEPDSVQIELSGNIIKNVKSVVVPHTGGMRGVEAAAAAGLVARSPDGRLEVISTLNEDDLASVRELLQRVPITVSFADTDSVFDIRITLRRGDDSAYVRILHDHLNVVEERRGDEVLFLKEATAEKSAKITDYSCLSVRDIVDFAANVDIDEVRGILDTQVRYNLAIAEEGVRGDWGASIGKTILSRYGSSPEVCARAYTAAGSDARMSGCELPVVINSGSGNQGITVSVPIVIYGREKGYSEEEIYRALLVSNLIAIHLKSGIGTLSAYCGAISAGCGAGAGIAYLECGTYRAVAHTLVNALAINSGVICDGAKASCAAKIASAVDAGFLGYHMFCDGHRFHGGDGIVVKGVENTIRNIGFLARDGMGDTDREIIKLMVGESKCK